MINIFPIKKKDLTDVAQFVTRNSNLKSDKVKKIISCNWVSNIQSYGFILKDHKEIVGYLGCLYSKRIINKKKLIFGNTTNWIVLEKYRQHSLKLLMELMKKNYVFTFFADNDVSSKIHEMLGFKKLDSYEITFNFFSFLFKNIFCPKTIIKEVNEKDKIETTCKKIISDHKNFDIFPIILNNEKKKVFSLFLKRPYGRIGNVKLMYSNDYDFTLNKINLIINYFIKKYKIFTVSVDKRFITNNNQIFVKKRKKIKWIYSKTNIKKKDVDLLYSELFGMYG